MTQTAYVERADGGDALFEEVRNVVVENGGALSLLAGAAVTFFAPAAWTSAHVVISDTEEAARLRAAYYARPLAVVADVA